MLLSVCAESSNPLRGEDARPRLAQRFSVRPVAVRLRLRLRPRDLVLLAESAAFPEYLLSLLVCSSSSARSCVVDKPDSSRECMPCYTPEKGATNLA